MYILTSHLTKGGVTKTTTTVHIARLLSKLGYKSVVVDLDHGQGNASTHMLNPEVHKINYQVVDVFKRKVEAGDAMIEVRDNLHIIPTFGNELELTEWIDSEMNKPTNQNFLKRLIKQLKDLNFDFILFDVPPGFSSLEQYVYLEVDEVIMPVLADSFAMDGLEILNEKVQAIVAEREDLGIKPLKRNKVLMSKYDKRTKLGKELIQAFSELENIKLFTARTSEGMNLLASTHQFCDEEEGMEGITEDYVFLTMSILEEVKNGQTT
jgi:chromosome partitioning protein